MIEFSWNDDRKAYELLATVELAASRDELFDFFGDAFQLERITPPWLSFHVHTPAPIKMKTGTLIDYRLKLRGIPIRWRTEISEWNPPGLFTDKQLVGPYSLWEHHHSFEPTENGTRVVDRVFYRVPGGPLIHRLFVKGELAKIFEYRQKQMFSMFGATQTKSQHEAR